MKLWLKIVFGFFAFILMIVGLVYVQKMQSQQVMQKPDIIIRVKDENTLLTKDEIENFLSRNSLFNESTKYQDLQMNVIERELKSKSQILDVNVYAKIGNQWTIDIQQRKPIVRIYNTEGKSFYVDENGSVIYLNSCLNCYSTKVLIANGDIVMNEREENNDAIINNKKLKTNLIVNKIYRISKYVCNDPFLSAQISQIYLREDGDFILIPQIGDQLIVFGTADSDKQVERKLKKLTTFYKEGIKYEGWDKYKEINLKFNDQIVCKKK